jgi:hypothetical protein
VERFGAIYTVRSEEESHGRPAARIACWTGLLGGPVAWLLQLMLAYLFVTYALYRGHAWTIPAVTIACLVLALLSAVLAFVEHRRARRAADAIASERTRFMAEVGMAAGVFFALVIVAQGLAMFFFTPHVLGGP